MWFAEPQIPGGQAKPLKMGVGKRKGKNRPSCTQLLLQKVRRARRKKRDQVRTDLLGNSDTNQKGQTMCCQFAYFQKSSKWPVTPLLNEPYVDSIV